MPTWFTRWSTGVMILLVWAGAATGTGSQASGPGDVDLAALLQATTARWNQGDLEGFIAPYADSTTFMTAAGPIGKEAMRARYASRFFTGGQPDQQLRFEQLNVRPLGGDHALMTGRFVLNGGDQPDRTGWFTLVWMRTAAGWRIVHDHSS